MSDSLADEVIARHVIQGGLISEPGCRGCGFAWPCDAYRLAVMVRDIEALAADHDPDSGQGDRMIRSSAVWAITRRETT